MQGSSCASSAAAACLPLTSPSPTASNAFVLLWDHFPKSSVLQVSDLIVLGTRGRLGEGGSVCVIKAKSPMQCWKPEP